MRIGIFVCYCGSNIAGTVDVEKVAKEALKLPGVVFTQTNLYTCSEPGQDQIKKAIEKNNPFHEEVWEILGLDPSSEERMLEHLRNDYTNAETFMKMAQGIA